ncbi:unnamed protein product [Trifolium pratense]|uniref:Uncharacterized protein n=1 Tax=Trifolium pratense TaxID=57577 RepID=A0ACB0JE53_TRIPR|nr:unnamed protein product [Trifolium pratense]
MEDAVGCVWINYTVMFKKGAFETLLHSLAICNQVEPNSHSATRSFSSGSQHKQLMLLDQNNATWKELTSFC